MVVSWSQVTLGNGMGVEAEVRLATVGGWRGGGAVAGPVVVATVTVTVSVTVGTVTVVVMLRSVVMVAGWSRRRPRRCRQSAVRVDIWSQARTGGPGGPGRTGWQGVPVEPSVVVINKVVRLQVVTGPINKWVWVR